MKKIREKDFSNYLAAINRAQTGYYIEYEQFAATFEDLDLIGFTRPKSKYYTVEMLTGDLQGIVIARSINNQIGWMGDKIAGVSYNLDTNTFNSVVCVATKESNYRIFKPSKSIINSGVVRNKFKVKCGQDVRKIDSYSKEWIWKK